MDVNSSFLYVITGATLVAALAMVLVVVFMIITARAARSIASRLSDLAPRAESALEKAVKTLDDSQRQMREVSAKTTAVLDLTRTQLERTDQFLSDATARARVQLDRVELVLDDTISRVHETIMVVNRGVLRPLKEIGAVSSGVRAAFQQLLRGGRPSVAQATTDEEMFI